MSGASLRRNALLLVGLTVVVAIVGDWSQDRTLSGLWHFPAALLLAGLAYESWLVARSGLTIGISAEGAFFLGRRSEVVFVCTHALKRRLTIQVAPVAPDFFDLDDRIETLSVREGERGEIRRGVICSRLGRYEWPSLGTRIAGPLGLAWWPRLVVCRRDVRVLPDLFRTSAEVKGVMAPGYRAAEATGGEVEVLGLRDYRSGDPPRVIDWKATARANRLVSRDFSQEHGLQILIVIDAGRSSALRAGTLDRFGHYVNVAARLAQFAVEGEDLVGLVIYADRPLAALAPARGASALVRLRALLAPLGWSAPNPAH